MSPLSSWYNFWKEIFCERIVLFIMKKTPLKRKTQLKAKTALTSKTSLTRTPFSSMSSFNHNKSANSLKKTNSLKAKPYQNKTVSDDTLCLAFPKFSRVRNAETIKECTLDFCEICGRPTSCEPHHIIHRGAGGPDMPENLIQLCPTCHRQAHDGQWEKERLFSIVGRRLHQSVEEIEEKIQKARGRI